MSLASRRDALLGLLAGAAIEAVLEKPLGEGAAYFWKTITAPFDPDRSLRQAVGEVEYTRLISIKSLFTDRGHRVGLVPGNAHFAFPNSFHPDDEWAADILLKYARLMSQDVVLKDEVILKASNGSFVCMGSPVSNLMTRTILEYEYIDASKPQLGFKRNAAPMLTLPFEFELDAAKIKSLPKPRSTELIKEHKVPNWSLKTSNGLYFQPTTRSNDIDFMLVTRAPNLLEERGRYADFANTITMLSGTHGVGTAAVRLLFERPDILQQLEQVAATYEYWQALVTIEGMTREVHPISGTVRAIAKSLGSDIEYGQVTF